MTDEAKVNFTVHNKLDEFTSTISWLYDVKESDIRAVMKEARVYLTKERIERINSDVLRYRAEVRGLNPRVPACYDVLAVIQ